MVLFLVFECVRQTVIRQRLHSKHDGLQCFYEHKGFKSLTSGISAVKYTLKNCRLINSHAERKPTTHHDMNNLRPCSLHWDSRNIEPPSHYGAYYIRDLVLTTMNHGLALDAESAAEAQDELMYALIEGLHELYDNQNQEHVDHILKMARVVDQYFLGGYLTDVRRHPSCQRLCHLRIYIADGNVNCRDSYSSSRVSMREDGNDSVPVVDIDIDSEGAWSIAQIIELVIHEMVHGYLMLFSCHGGFSYQHGGCSDHSNRRGSHGGSVRMLLKSIFETIQEWDDVLGGFGEDFIADCNHHFNFWRGRFDALFLLRGIF